MNKSILASVVLMTVVMSLVALPVAAQGTPPGNPKPGDVIFKDNFQEFDGVLAKGWHAWGNYGCVMDWEPDDKKAARTPPCGLPEYKQSNPADAFPNRAHDGHDDNAQQYFTVYSGHNAGIYRQFDVLPGAILEVSAWGTSWSSVSDNPNDPGEEARMQIGIDPHGGVDPEAKTVVWGEVGNPFNKWTLIPPVKATAGPEGKVTVFLRSNPRWPMKHNDMYWDDVTITYQGQGAPSIPNGGTPVPGVVVVVPTPSDPVLAGLALGGVPGMPLPDPVLKGIVAAQGQAGHDLPGETGGTSWIGAVLAALLLVIVGGVTYTQSKGGLR
jgi:hypothetical protein